MIPPRPIVASPAMDVLSATTDATTIARMNSNVTMLGDTKRLNERSNNRRKKGSVRAGPPVGAAPGNVVADQGPQPSRPLRFVTHRVASDGLDPGPVRAFATRR